MCSQYVIRISSKARSIIYTIGKLIKSSKCIEFTQDGKKNLREVFDQCLEDIKKFIENEVIKKVNVKGFGKCLPNCLGIFQHYIKLFKEIETAYNYTVRSFTSFGDSTFKQNELPDEVKRILRHIEISSDLFSIHFVRIGLVISFVRDYMECVVKYCNSEDDYKRALRFMFNWSKKIKDDVLKEVFLEEFNKWCKEFNIKCELIF